MSNAGRPRKPTELKKNQGTYRKDRDFGEIEPEIVAEVPPPPKVLTTIAKQEWVVVCQWLFEKNLLAQTDLSLIAIYCNEVARYWELDKAIRKYQKKAFSEPKFPDPPEPPYIEVDMPEDMAKALERAYRLEVFQHNMEVRRIKDDHASSVKMHKDYISLQAQSSTKAKDYGIQFGYTPAARTRIKPPEKKKKSALQALMEGN